MPVISELATALGRKDDLPNQQLAHRIAQTGDKEAVRELFEILSARKEFASDAIKVIYETGLEKPELVAPYGDELILLLGHRNNRLQWGAMMALNAIGNHIPDKLYESLGFILAAADKGSVITNDHCVGILIKLCALESYAVDAFSLLMKRIRRSPVNQLPMYAEKALTIVNDKNGPEFFAALTARLGELEKSKKLRLEKVIKAALKRVRP